MASVTAKDFIKETQASNVNGSEKNAVESAAENGDAYYIFDSKKATELKRLDEQHHALGELMHGKLVHAPVQNPKRILDIGCGTGITTVALARQFPESEVIGLDINPVPPIHEKPPNVTYIQARIEDLVQQTTHPDPAQPHEILRPASFDYIFSRYLVLVISDWAAYISTCTTLLAAGGWLEIHELSAFKFYNATSPTIPLNTSPSYQATWTWTDVVLTNTAEKGFDFSIGKTSHASFLAYGLNEVTSKHYPFTFYEWLARPEAGRMARYVREFGRVAFPAMMRMFTSEATEEQRVEWERQIAEMYEPAKGGEGLHWRFYVVCGRKEEMR